MWNTAVSNLHASLRTVVQAFLALGQENPATMGFAVVVGLMALVLAAEISNGWVSKCPLCLASNLRLSSPLIWRTGMLNHFDTSPIQDETGAIGFDLTSSELATTLVPVLIGMAVFGIIAVLMLL